MNVRHLSPAGARRLEEQFRNNIEAHELLGLIAAEFRSDPTSTQCFDPRIVERVRRCVATYERHSIPAPKGK